MSSPDKEFLPIQPNECSVPIVEGQYLVFPDAETDSTGVDYIRFVSESGHELLYYDNKEWAEEPQSVMGAIMAAIQNGADV